MWVAYVSGAFGLAFTAQLNFLVPLRALELGASFDVIGLIVGASALAPALLSIPTGAFIDRFGARRTFRLFCAATAVVAALFVFAGSYWWLLLLQPVVGVCRNVAWVASQSYITMLGADEHRTAIAGRFSFFSNVGQMIGPALIGAAAQVVGYRWAFVALGAYAAAFAVIGLWLPKTQWPDPLPHLKHGIGVRSALEFILRRPIQVALLLSGTRMWIAWIYSAFLPIYLVNRGLEPGTVGVVMATAGVVAALLAPTAGMWTRAVSVSTLGTLSLGCGVVGLLLAPHLSAMPWLLLVPAAIGVGNGLSLPVLLMLIAGASPQGRRGVALGLRAGVNQMAGTAGPVAVGAVISSFGMLAGFSIGALVAAGALAGARVLAIGNGRPA